MKQAILNAVKMLPSAVRQGILHVGFNAAPERFAELAYLYANAPDMERGLTSLRNRGFSPPTILDVGAYEGSWSIMARKIWPAADIIMVEANTDKRPSLENVASQIGARIHFQLLGSKAEQDINFVVMESGSSVYEENSPLARRVERRRTATVDAILAGQAVDVIKLDVQGFELEVLKGAESTMPGCSAIILEVSLIEINNGAPLLHEVLAFMKERRFITYEIVGVHRRPLDRAMNQLDILFVPEDSPLRSDKSHFAVRADHVS